MAISTLGSSPFASSFILPSGQTPEEAQREKLAGQITAEKEKQKSSGLQKLIIEQGSMGLKPITPFSSLSQTEKFAIQPITAEASNVMSGGETTFGGGGGSGIFAKQFAIGESGPSAFDTRAGAGKENPIQMGSPFAGAFGAKQEAKDAIGKEIKQPSVNTSSSSSMPTDEEGFADFHNFAKGFFSGMNNPNKNKAQSQYGND
jgi:hypothetical protein